MMRNLTTWWRAVRPYAYPASLIPALLGIAVAAAQGVRIDPLVALLTVAGAVAAHTGANLMNDYRDFRLGFDRPGTLGGCGLLVDGTLSARQVLVGSLVAFAAAGGIALFLCWLKGLWLAWFCLGGLVAGAGYVLPPFNLKYRALGDVTVFVAFGVGITVGAYLLQAGRFSAAPLLASIPVGLLIAALLHVNNMRDLGDDLDSGFRTLAARLGERGSRALFALLVLSPYLICAGALLARAWPIGTALMLVTLPSALRLASDVSFRPHPESAVLVAAVPRVPKLCLLVGMALIAGFLLARIFPG